MKWVRAGLSVLIVAGIVTGFFLDKIPGETFMTIGGVVVTWWFVSRDKEKSRE